MEREKKLKTILSKKATIIAFAIFLLIATIILVVNKVESDESNYFEGELEEVPVTFDTGSVDFLKEYLEDEEIEDLYAYIENLYLENSDKFDSFSYVKNSFTIKSEKPFRANLEIKSNTDEVFTLHLAKLTVGLDVTHD